MFRKRPKSEVISYPVYFWEPHWLLMGLLETSRENLTGMLNVLTHWGRVVHMCISKLTIIGSDNGLSPGQDQSIIGTNAGILLIRPMRINFSDILIEIYTFSFNKIHLKMAAAILSLSQCFKHNQTRCTLQSIHCTVWGHWCFDAIILYQLKYKIHQVLPNNTIFNSYGK